MANWARASLSSVTKKEAVLGVAKLLTHISDNPATFWVISLFGTILYISYYVNNKAFLIVR